MNPYQKIYAILDEGYSGFDQLFDLAKKYLDLGIKTLQLRCKSSSKDQIIDLAKQILSLKKNYQFQFIINDHLDILLKTNADGIHLGQDDEEVLKVREKIGKDIIIGLSTHNLEQVKLANDLPINYIGFGPVFKTSSKENPDPIVGVDLLKEAILHSKYPVVAIGGIHQDNISQLKNLKLDKIALISALAENPEDFRGISI